MDKLEGNICLKALNEHITCHICKGYLIDATTITECLHTFCKTCIVKWLKEHQVCPICEAQIQKNIRSDPSLQDIVYKIVPGLFTDEMRRRREFYKTVTATTANSESLVNLTNEEKGEMRGERLIFSPDDIFYLSIEYQPEKTSYSYIPLIRSTTMVGTNGFPVNNNGSEVKHNQRRYFRCKGSMEVRHLKKLLQMKYELKENNNIDLLYKHDRLEDDYTMVDLAYIYSWRRSGPLSLYYKISET
ncbi:polycomb complex protein BMI-1-like [Panonychus citri]|uniref:polycomb complex protein BMI-1-like n=1 Tax=Panonychus citri TaxID=50023 RepID=UPI002307B080|nr:polycomb complex protein BMI-1-like [Panonychus citri]